MRTWVLGIVVGIFFSTLPFSNAAEPTKEEKVKALVDRGLAHIKAKGLEAALVDFNDAKGKFVEGEFYLFGYDFKGSCIALGVNQKMVGKSQWELMDADGKPIIQEFIKLVKAKGKAWYGYKWSNPTTKKIQDKMSYIAVIPGHDALLGSGYYK